MEECKSYLEDQKERIYFISFFDRNCLAFWKSVSGFMKDGNQFPEVLPFATMLAVICGMMMCVIGFGTDVFYGYDFFLRFCHTRKEFLLSSGAVTFLQSLIMVVVLKIFLELEMLISHSLFSGSPATGQMETAVEIFSRYVSLPGCRCMPC